MFIRWRTPKTLGMLPDTWPEVMDSEKCYKVTTEEEKEAQKGKGEGEFPIDPKFKKVLKLVEEYSDVFHDHLDESDRLCDGVLDLKLKDGAEPYLTNRVQRINFHEMPGCMKALQEHIDGGLLVEHDPRRTEMAILWSVC